MNELVRRSGEHAVGRPAGRQPPNGLDVDTGEWSGSTFGIVDLGAVLPAPRGRLVAEMAASLSGMRRRRDGSHYRRRLGWRADQAGVVIVLSDQPLRARPDGRFEPAAEWRVTAVHAHDALDSRRRLGDVRHDDFGSGTGAARPNVRAAAAGLGRDEADAAYLPTEVRAGFVRAVPDPDVAVAQALRHFEADGRVLHHSVRALRLAGNRAVVVLASRQARATTWQVEQVTYDLGWDAIEGARPAPEISR